MPTSLWSEISWRGLASHARQDGEPLTTVSAREQERLAALPRADASDRPTTQPPPSPDLIDLIQRRRAWWRNHLDRRAMYSLGRWGRFLTILEERRWTTALSLGALIPGVALFAVWLLLGPTQSDPGTIIAAAIALAIATPGLAIPLLLATREHRLSWWLRENRCTGCAKALPTDPTSPAGPARCPDCNLAWPLVPTPIPAAAVALVKPDVAKPPKPTGDAWHTFAPARGLRPAAWDIIGPAISAIDPPSLRAATRHTWTGTKLPRFGGRATRQLHDNTLSFAFIAALALASFVLPSSVAIGLLMTIGAVSLPLLALRKPNAWRYSAFRRERCRIFNDALQGHASPSLVHETLLQRRSFENVDLIATRLRANGSKFHTTTDRLIVTVPLSIYFGSFGLSRLVTAIAPDSAQSTRSIFGSLICPSMFIVIAMLVYVTTSISRRRDRLIASVGTTRCCNCNYDLAGIPNAIPPESLGSLTTGPAHCPECSAPWPLIPPRAT